MFPNKDSTQWVLPCLQIHLWALPSMLHRRNPPATTTTHQRGQPILRVNQYPKFLYINTRRRMKPISKSSPAPNSRFAETILFKEHIKHGTNVIINNQRTSEFLLLFLNCLYCFTASILRAPSLWMLFTRFYIKRVPCKSSSPLMKIFE